VTGIRARQTSRAVLHSRPRPPRLDAQPAPRTVPVHRRANGRRRGTPTHHGLSPRARRPRERAGSGAGGSALHRTAARFGDRDARRCGRCAAARPFLGTPRHRIKLPLGGSCGALAVPRLQRSEAGPTLEHHDRTSGQRSTGLNDRDRGCYHDPLRFLGSWDLQTGQRTLRSIITSRELNSVRRADPSHPTREAPIITRRRRRHPSRARRHTALQSNSGGAEDSTPAAAKNY
jgi:hypothetical protein